MALSTADARIEVCPLLPGVGSTGPDAFLDEYFQSEVLPLLTPIALDRSHPIPRLREGSWGLVVRFRGPRSPRYGVILVHTALPMVVDDPKGGRTGLAHLIACRLAGLFEQAPIESSWTFRVCATGPLTLDPRRHAVARLLASALARSKADSRESLPCAA
jgi:polyphosphate kinase